jgi:hypothetical protein
MMGDLIKRSRLVGFSMLSQKAGAKDYWSSDGADIA